MSKDIIVINNSGIKQWRRCRQAFYYKEVEKIEPRMTALPLKRGTWLHLLMEAFLKKEDWLAIHTVLEKEFNKLMLEEQDLYGDLPSECLRMMTMYEKTYTPWLKTVKIHAVELNFAKSPVEVAPGVFLKGKIDAVIEELKGPYKGLWIGEHKTHKKIPGEIERFINTQSSVYTTAAEKLLKTQVRGTLWDYIRTKPPTKPQILARGGVSVNKKIDTDEATFLEVLAEAGEDPKDPKYAEALKRARENKFLERKYLPKSERVIKQLIKEIIITAREINKLKMFPYRTFDKFNCQGCGYRSLCEAELLGLDSSFIRKSEFKPVDQNKEELSVLQKLLGGGEEDGEIEVEEDDL